MLSLSNDLVFLAKSFSDANHTLYITGGYVRDFLMGQGTKSPDIDICSNMSADAVQELVTKIGYKYKGRNSALGTVAIVAPNGEAYEYTAFRRDSYRDGGTHKPQAVTFVDSVEEDALRRDFTLNSIYYDILDEKIVDPLGGVNDLKHGIIKTADTPDVTFKSDGLRLIRLVRFAARFGFKIDPATKTAAIKNAALIKDITQPRITEEFLKILHVPSGETAYTGLKLLEELNLLFYIIPELKPTKNFAQNKKWHEYDVLEHTFQAVKFSPPAVRMAALFHDIGKPESELRYNKSAFHPKIAAEILPNILKRFGYSQKRADGLIRLVLLHMYDSDCNMREKKTKRFLLNNQDILDDLLDLKQADYLAKGKASDICPTYAKWRAVFADMQHAPLDIKDLALTPTALINSLAGVMPQHETGKVMQRLLEAVAVDGVKNDADTLLKMAMSFFTK